MKRLLLFMSAALCAGKAVAQPYLLRAQALYVYDSSGLYHLEDSTWYYYSGSRGGAVQPQMNETSINRYNHGDAGIKYDSVFSAYPYTNTLTMRMVHTYDTADNVLQEHNSRLMPVGATYRWDNLALQANTYDTANSLTFSLYRTWDGAGYYESSRSYYGHDTAHRIDTSIIDTRGITTSGLWAHAKRIIHTYDTAGNRIMVLIQNPDPMGWIDYGRYTMTYDTAGNMLTQLVQTWMSDPMGIYSWTNIDSLRYTYNTANKQLTAAYYWLVGTATALLTKADTIVYDAHNNMVTLTAYAADSSGLLRRSRQYNYTYNAYDQLTSIRSATWGAAGAWATSAQAGAQDYQRYYYYSNTPNPPYDPIPDSTPEGVPGAGSAACSIVVYPSPAAETIAITIDQPYGQPYSILLCDAQGRTWAEWPKVTASHFTDVVAVSALPAGNYLLKVTTAGGMQVQRFVVAH